MVGEYLHRGLEGFFTAFAVEGGFWKRVTGIASVSRFRNNLAGSDKENSEGRISAVVDGLSWRTFESFLPLQISARLGSLNGMRDKSPLCERTGWHWAAVLPAWGGSLRSSVSERICWPGLGFRSMSVKHPVRYVELPETATKQILHAVAVKTGGFFLARLEILYRSFSFYRRPRCYCQDRCEIGKVASSSQLFWDYMS